MQGQQPVIRQADQQISQQPAQIVIKMTDGIQQITPVGKFLLTFLLSKSATKIVHLFDKRLNDVMQSKKKKKKNERNKLNKNITKIHAILITCWWIWMWKWLKIVHINYHNEFSLKRYKISKDGAIGVQCVNMPNLFFFFFFWMRLHTWSKRMKIFRQPLFVVKCRHMIWYWLFCYVISWIAILTTNPMVFTCVFFCCIRTWLIVIY